MFLSLDGGRLDTQAGLLDGIPARDQPVLVAWGGVGAWTKWFYIYGKLNMSCGSNAGRGALPPGSHHPTPSMIPLPQPGPPQAPGDRSRVIARLDRENGPQPVASCLCVLHPRPPAAA